MKSLILYFLNILILFFPVWKSFSIPRSKVLENAKAYAEHKWVCKVENTVVNCSSSWESDYTPGEYIGVPYDWGGYKTLSQFDEDLKNGLGAGSHQWHGVLECTTGVDCSGFVSQCLETSHHSTATMYEITYKINPDEILPGDIYNKPKYHVVLWVAEGQNGNPIFYEASGSASKVRLNQSVNWTYLNNYIPRRYKKIVNDDEILSKGTLDNPIVISEFPFVDKNNTDFSNEYNIDYYSCDPDNLEGGPEIYYLLKASKNLKFLTITVEDEFFTDIDIHLLKDSPLPENCMYRHDKKISVKNLDAGTYYIVADTWEGNKGHPFSGEYVITVDGELEDGSKQLDNGTEFIEKVEPEQKTELSFEKSYDVYEVVEIINKKDSTIKATDTVDTSLDTGNAAYDIEEEISNGSSGCSFFTHKSNKNSIIFVFSEIILLFILLIFSKKRKILP